MSFRSRLTPSNRRARWRLAFSLIELLVAMAITAILGLLVASITASVLQNYRSLRSAGGPESVLSSALDAISSDLQAMLLNQASEAETLSIENETVNGRTFPWLVLLTSVLPGDGQAQAPVRAVSYRIAYQPLDPLGRTNPRFGLYREEATAEDTFLSVKGRSSPIRSVWRDNNATPEASNLVAGDVIDFRMSFFERGNRRWISLTGQEQGLVMKRGHALTKPTNRLIVGGISSVEIRLRVLSEQGSQLVRDGSLSLDEAISRHSQTMSRRISLPVGL